jgi:hypothetical protein
MAIEGKNTDLYRRLRLYGFGFLLGVLLVSVVYKGKSCQMPGSIKLEELSKQKLTFSSKGKCIMDCNLLLEKDIVHVLATGKINYDKSDVRGEPFPTYVVEGKTEKGVEAELVIEDIDVISTVKSAIDTKAAHTCACN